ncbi:hypothetical protein ABCV69_004572 [Pseudomonas aeruginosa]|uniref:hypothetical protein n=1 Tax=Pseudomonas aeruginosa TaxID=287 RepID=UPI00053D7575|nr:MULTISPECIES: hypothetical protein [Pseudomonadaceae]EKY4114507.1 hypothetical protein [Pseudomonas aeruginosa]ELJ2277910.1 hypothetical protein [Pseudomonas aeruginosa]KJS79102.1 MAG: hypothetical protein JL55_13905 [[Pseudomonas] sp. BICA1-14]MBS2052396.1 hypothetical protein [Pseudomonas aeruginosa]HBP0221277.1 hypothetical protein [Pseudomonas aeruginosa]
MSCWEQSCRVQKVMQRDRLGCGVACAAMVSGKPYGLVRQLFVDNGIGARKKRPLATNFSELQYALSLLGIESELKRWSGWDAVEGLGIVAVSNGQGAASRNWHWIVAERHANFGIVVHDPDFDLPSFSSAPPPGVHCHPFSEYQARKSWIRISPRGIHG